MFCTVNGIEPRWPGVKLPWAIIRPNRSKTAAEKSSPSRTASENAVRRSAVPISSATEISVFQRTVSVMGSTARLRAGRGGAVSVIIAASGCR